MSDTQTAGASPPRSGEVFASKYNVVEPLPPLLLRSRWQVEDLESKDGALTLTSVGVPSKDNDPDKVKRGFERTQRAASWIRHPGVVVPRDFLYEGGTIYSVATQPSELTVEKYIEENSPTLPQLVGWVLELSTMLEQLHESRQPQFLGRLPTDNLRITPDGQVQLLGFDINPELKLEFRPLSEAKAAPEAKYDARSDVWCLSTLLQELIEKSGTPVKKVFREEADLKNLITQCQNDDPEKRIPNMSTFKGRLEKMRWKDAPKPKTYGVMDAPIQVLTVQEESAMAKVWKEHRPYLLVGIMAFLLFLAVLVNVVPNNE